MNKILNLVILLISINFASEINIDIKIIEGIYDKFIYIMKGMEGEGKTGCFDNLRENKDFYLGFFKSIIEFIINGNITVNYTLLNNFNSFSDSVLGALSDCRLFEFFDLYNRSIGDNETRVKFYEDIGKNIFNNSEKFRGGTTKFVRKRTLDDRLELIGVISSAILNITLD